VKRALIVAAVVLTLAGCSTITSGTITDKTDYPASTYTTFACVMSNKYGCTTWMPQFHYIPESFRFDLNKQKDAGWVYVDRGTFDQYSVGDWYGAEQ
jgi:uncharacterized protein YceK